MLSDYPADCCPDKCYKRFPFLAGDDDSPYWQGWANLRQKTYQLIENKYFETAVITMILLSSLALVSCHIGMALHSLVVKSWFSILVCLHLVYIFFWFQLKPNVRKWKQIFAVEPDDTGKYAGLSRTRSEVQNLLDPVQILWHISPFPLFCVCEKYQATPWFIFCINFRSPLPLIIFFTITRDAFVAQPTKCSHIKFGFLCSPRQLAEKQGCSETAPGDLCHKYA